MAKDEKITRFFALRHSEGFSPMNLLLRMTKRKAFTLAEVLITLGIIGVVAALTIPTLSKNIQHKIFEVKFKKATSLIAQVIQKTKYDLDVESLDKYCFSTGVTPCNNVINLQIKTLTSANKMNSHTEKYSITRNASDIQSFNGKSITYFDSNQHAIIYTTDLHDGMYLGSHVGGGYLSFAVDLNGASKPNKLGHDIFFFVVSKNGKDRLTSLTPNNNITDEDAETYYENYEGPWKAYYINSYGNPCNLTSQRMYNGIGCTYYALKNECPWDNTKTYWACLP